MITRKFLIVSVLAAGLMVGVFVLQGFNLDTPQVVLAGDSSTHDQTYSADDTLTPGTHTWGDLTVNNFSTLTLQGNCGSNLGVTIIANNITIEAGSAIVADGQGCAGGIVTAVLPGNGGEPLGSGGAGAGAGGVRY